MTPPDNYIDILTEQVFKVLTESPWGIDTNALLTAADNLLETLQCTPNDELAMHARAMAYAAFDYSVFQGDTTNLRDCTKVFLASHVAAVQAATT